MKILLLSILLFTTSLFANIGKVTAVKGNAVVIRESKTINVNLGFLIEEKDQIKTDKNARLQLQFKDKTIISLGKDSLFNVEEYFFDEKQPKKTKASFKMAKGVFKSITGRIGKINPTKFKLKTKSATIGIRGTIFFGAVSPRKPDNIACTAGSITVSTPQGTVEVPAGQFTTVTPGALPTPPASIPPAEQNKLENDSGASQSEKESGQNADTVEKEKSEPVTQEPANQEPNAGPTTETVTVDTTFVDQVVAVAKETKEKKSEEDENDEQQNKIDEIVENTTNPDSTNPDPTNPTNTLKTATYDVFHTARIYDSTYASQSNNGQTQYSHNSIFGSPFDEAKTTTSRAQFSITNGKISGESTVYFYDSSYGTAVDYFPLDSIQDYITLDVSELPTLSAPESTYKGFSHIYKKEEIGKYGDTTYRGNDLDLFVDSKQEFFIGFDRKWENTGGTSYTDEAGNVITDYTNYFNEENMVVFGEKSNYQSLPSDGISLYSEPLYYSPEGIEPTYTEVDGFYRSDDFFNNTTSLNHYLFNYDTSANNYSYYSPTNIATFGTHVNWKNKNILDYTINFYYDSYYNKMVGNGDIELGKISADSDGKAKVNIKTIDFYSYRDEGIDTTIKTSSENSDIYIFGSEYQGIGGTATFVDSTNSYFEEDTYGAFRANGLAMEASTTPTLTSTFNGFAINQYSAVTPEELTISLDRTNSITGTIRDNSYITFGGSLGIDAAYITDDTFAALNFSGTTDMQNNISSGWLVAVDTGLFSEESVDDEISWGLWGVDTNTENYSDFDIGFWVAGVNRVEDMIDTLGTDFIGTYTGNVMGIVQGDVNGILDPLKSTITLALDFGAGTINSTLNGVISNQNFDEMTQTYIDQTITSNKNFIEADFSGALYQAENNNGADLIQGSLYNTGSSTAGAFKFTEETFEVSGVYKAQQTANEVQNQTP